MKEIVPSGSTSQNILATPANLPLQTREALQRIGIVSPGAVSTKQAAAYLTQVKGIPTAPSSLEVYRCSGRGPKYKKIHSRVFYSLEWLNEYADGVEIKIFDPAKIKEVAR